jgi:putative FmdB family regulatory protein
MPTYTYDCLTCEIKKEEVVKMEQRDEIMISCPKCGYRMIRGVDRPGLVWAPTAGGMK